MFRLWSLLLFLVGVTCASTTPITIHVHSAYGNDVTGVPSFKTVEAASRHLRSLRALSRSAFNGAEIVLHDGVHYVSKDFHLKSEDGGEGPNARVVYRAALPQESTQFHRDKQGVAASPVRGEKTVKASRTATAPTAVISAGIEVPSSAFTPWRGSIVMADLAALGLTDYGTFITGGLKVRLH